MRSEDEAEIEDDDPVASLGQILDRQPHARIGDVEYRPDPALVIPLPRDGEADIDLVLMVGDEELDRLAQHGTAEILDRHSRHFGAARPGEVGIGAGLVVENADPKGFIGMCGRGGGKDQQQEGENLPKHYATSRGHGGSLPQLSRKRNRDLARCPAFASARPRLHRHPKQGATERGRRAELSGREAGRRLAHSARARPFLRRMIRIAVPIAPNPTSIIVQVVVSGMEASSNAGRPDPPR